MNTSINRKMRITAIAILIAVFNVIVFILPFAQTISFWIAYIFAMIALISQEFVWIFAWEKMNSLKSRFLGIPILQISLLYVIVQVIISFVFIAAPVIPWQASLIEGIVWLALCAILIMAVDIGRDEVECIDEKVKAKVSYIKSLQADVEQIVFVCETDSLKGELKKLAEAFRYSDPMSDASLEGLETNISELVGELKILVTSEYEEDVLQKITEIKTVLNERNVKTKTLKQK